MKILLSSLFTLFFVFSAFALELTDSDAQKQVKLDNFCKKINIKFKQFGWGKIVCKPQRWIYDTYSVKGEPLIYQSFMNAGPDKPVTLILCTIHGDEYTSPYLCVRLVRDIVFDSREKYKNVNVVVAPFVNPDGFLAKKASRLNANGVDCNRNFPTADWNQEALQSWKKKFKKDPRRFPGNFAGSEPETRFQMDLIEKFKPEKIVAVHAPYAFLDYDISGERTDTLVREVKEVAESMSKQSNNFRLVDFNVFPGSLGTYAGLDKNIPTFTLELPKSGSQFGEPYWERFRTSFLYIVNYVFKNQVADHRAKNHTALAN